MEFLKKNWSLLSVGLITVVLAIIAIGTAWKLYQAGQEPVAPTAPPSVPKAEEPCPCVPDDPQFDNFCLHSPSTPNCPMTEPGGYCDPNGNGDFSDADWDRGYYEYLDQCGEVTPPPPTDPCVLQFGIPTGTPTPTPTGTATPTPTSTGTPTPTPTGTVMPSPTPTPTATGTPTPTPTSPPGTTPTPTPTLAELPEAGISLPTVGALLGGAVLVILSILLAL